MNKFIYKIIMLFISIFAPESYLSGPVAKILPEMTIDELLLLKPVYDSFYKSNFCCNLKVVDQTVWITVLHEETEHVVSFEKDRLQQILDGFICELSQDYVTADDLKLLPGHIDILRKTFDLALQKADLGSIVFKRIGNMQFLVSIQTASVASSTQIEFLK